MNINVWITKICKALEQFFWIGFLLMNLSMEVPQPPFLLPQLMQGKKCLLPAVLIYRHVLKRFHKVLFWAKSINNLLSPFSMLVLFVFLILLLCIV